MNWRAVTICLLVVVVVALSLWDVGAAAFGGEGATISEIVLSVAQRHPIVPLAIGVLIGHLFWSQGHGIVPTVPPAP